MTLRSTQRQFPARAGSAALSPVRLLPTPPPQHTGKLVTTEIGAMYACSRCKKLLDADGWARPCAAPEDAA